MKLINKIIKLFFKPFLWLRKRYWKFFKAETFGVRTLVYTDAKILLVKHRYSDIWVMPGGGIEKGESAESAAIRELIEEAGIKAFKIDYKLGYYKNTTGGKNDNISCFVVTDFQKIPDFKRTFMDFLEIAEARWYEINNISVPISRATKARINEFLANKKDLTGNW